MTQKLIVAAEKLALRIRQVADFYQDLTESPDGATPAWDLVAIALDEAEQAIAEAKAAPVTSEANARLLEAIKRDLGGHSKWYADRYAKKPDSQSELWKVCRETCEKTIAMLSGYMAIAATEPPKESS